MRENPKSECFLLLNHGVLVIGSDIREALSRLELLDRMATIYLLSKQHMEYQPLSGDSSYGLRVSDPISVDDDYSAIYDELTQFSQRAYLHVVLFLFPDS